VSSIYFILGQDKPSSQRLKPWAFG